MANPSRSCYPRIPYRGIGRLANVMTDVSSYEITVKFHGVTYYGTLKSDLGPHTVLTDIAEIGDIGDGFKFAFPGETIEFKG